MMPAGTLTRVLTVVVLLFSLPIFLDVTRLPDSAAAQEYVFSALTPCNGLRICNLCGEVLEMVDLVQRALIDPFTNELSLSVPEWDSHNLHSYQQCLLEPLQRGCDTLIHKVKTQRVEYAKMILEQILEDVSFQHKWGLLGEDYIVSSAMRLTSYIFDAQERALLGRHDAYKEDGEARSIVYQHSTLSLSGDPAMESLVTRVWFLRRDVQPLHQEFCYPVCEGKLGMFARLRLAVIRFYIHHSIKPRLMLLRQHHTGTLIVVQLMMIGVAACIERLMSPTTVPTGPSPVGNGVLAHVPDGRRATDGSGVSHGSGSAGGSSGGGKSHNRQGRRR